MDYYVLGVICGVVLALVVSLLVWRKFKNGNTPTGKYDERQIIGRGKAFQAGFFTLLIAGAVYNTWNYISPLPGSSFVWNLGIALGGVAVFALVAIHFDAYLGLYDNPKRFLFAGCCFIIAMTCSAISNLHGDRPFQHDLGILNLGVGLVWLLIVAALLLHRPEGNEE